MNKRRSFMKSAMGLGAAGTMGAMAAGAATGDRSAVQGGIRFGNLYFSSGLTGVRPEARKDPLAFGGDIKEQTHTILKTHKANLESMGSSLEKVLKVTVFLADVKTEKSAMNEVYAQFSQPGASTVGGGSAVSGYRHPRRNRNGGLDSLNCRFRTNSHWRVSDVRL
jgi:enamine deaminase RidA (YjgF/YER057c/UK114 family)